MASDVERILGQLEASHTALARSIDRVEQKQDQAALKQDAHAVEDRQLFELLRTGQRENLERIARIEPVIDAIEGQQAAIASIEERLDASDKKTAIEQEVLKATIVNNAKWRNSLIAASGVMGIGVGSGAQSLFGKVGHFVSVMFGGK